MRKLGVHVMSTRKTKSNPRIIAAATLLIAGCMAACGGDDSDPIPDGDDVVGDLTTISGGELLADGPGGVPDATGSVRIAEDNDGNQYVVLSDNFSQEMGPGDTQLILATTQANVEEQRTANSNSVSEPLGVVPNGFSGSAAYRIPENVDVGAYSYLIVWCPTAGVNFGAAALITDVSDTIVRTNALVSDDFNGVPYVTGTVSVVRSGSQLSIALSSDFQQLEGPGDTQIFLARSADNITAQRNADPSSVSEVLGIIPNGATGAQSFALSSNVDVDDFDYVVIWCPTAGINFGAALLPARSGTLAGDGAGGAPDATGGVSFSRGADGSLTLELGTDFAQEQGPGDTQIFLTTGSGSISEQRASGASNVSPVIGTIPNGATGARSFTIPDNIDADLYDYAIVWCPTAGVNFGVTLLQ